MMADVDFAALSDIDIRTNEDVAALFLFEDLFEWI